MRKPQIRITEEAKRLGEKDLKKKKSASSKELLKELGIDVVERLSLESMPTRHNLKYLQAKHEKMGHVMDVKEKLIFS